MTVSLTEPLFPVHPPQRGQMGGCWCMGQGDAGRRRLAATRRSGARWAAAGAWPSIPGMWGATGPRRRTGPTIGW